MFVVTFYSYKGGVGRTLALANVAYLLATDEEDPCRVLMWDFDLEAPGLQQIFKDVKISESGGFVDMVTDYLDKRKLPDVSDYIAKTGIENLDLLPAGRLGKEYSDKLERLNWQRLYDEYHGWDFIEKMKEDIQKQGYDYVLIDSRTGYSDVGGICTQQLPDLVVLIFRLNRQNIEGSAQVYQAIASWAEKSKRTIDVLPVISPAWPFASEEANELIHEATSLFMRRLPHNPRRRFSSRGMIGRLFRFLSFDSALTFGERLLSKERDNFAITPPICEDYQSLTRDVRERNQYDPSSIRRQAESILNQAGPNLRREEYQEAFDLFSRLVYRRPGNVNEWMNLLRTARTAPLEMEQLFQSRIESFINEFADRPEVIGCAAFVQGEIVMRRIPGIPDPSKAIDYYSLAVENMEQPFEALKARARCFGLLGEYDRAVADLTRAIEILGQREDGTRNVSEFRELYSMRARLLFEACRYDEALRDLEPFRGLSPLNRFDVLLYIHVLSALERFDEALEVAARLEQMARTLEAPIRIRIDLFLHLAAAFISARALEKASNLLSEARTSASFDEDFAAIEMLLAVIKCLRSDQSISLPAMTKSIRQRVPEATGHSGWGFFRLKHSIAREKTQNYFKREQIENAEEVINAFEVAWKEGWERRLRIPQWYKSRHPIHGSSKRDAT